MESLAANIGLSIGGAILAVKLVREFFPLFIQRNLFGIDRCKKNPTQVPEPMGVIIATVYLIVLVLFIPIPFYGWLSNSVTFNATATADHSLSPFPYHHFVEFLSGLLSICCMILLGFADDIFDLRWRHKLLLPTLASLPLLMVYGANCNSTTILLPKQITYFFPQVTEIDIGFLYYVYMGMLAVFCTNAINILAGVNGLEAGQSIIIASSVCLFNIIQLFREETTEWYHLLSLYFLIPYITTSSVLLAFNWYPAQVFVGDTFCYWSGMTLAVVGILGHFSKTLLLFFLPQIFNFLFSVPQLFHLIPCPRHRMPKYNRETDKVEMSTGEFKASQVGILGSLILRIFNLLGLVHVNRFTRDEEEWIECSNMTLIILVLKCCGPLSEQTLTVVLLSIQTASTAVAFFIRFYMAGLVYEQVR